MANKLVHKTMPEEFLWRDTETRQTSLDRLMQQVVKLLETSKLISHDKNIETKTTI